LRFSGLSKLGKRERERERLSLAWKWELMRRKENHRI
jgi:hypothetical protein